MAKQNNRAKTNDFREAAESFGSALTLYQKSENENALAPGAAAEQTHNLVQHMAATREVAATAADSVFEEYVSMVNADIDEIDEKVEQKNQEVSDLIAEFTKLVDKEMKEAKAAKWEECGAQYTAVAEMMANANYRAVADVTIGFAPVKQDDDDDEEDDEGTVHKLEYCGYDQWLRREGKSRKLFANFAPKLTVGSNSYSSQEVVFRPLSIEVSPAISKAMETAYSKVKELKDEVLDLREESQGLQREISPDKIQKERNAYIRSASLAALDAAGRDNFTRMAVETAKNLRETRRAALKSNIAKSRK